MGTRVVYVTMRIRFTVSRNTDSCYTINNQEGVSDIDIVRLYSRAELIRTLVFNDVTFRIIFNTLLLLRAVIRLYICLQFSTCGRKWNVFRQSRSIREL